MADSDRLWASDASARAVSRVASEVVKYERVNCCENVVSEIESE